METRKLTRKEQLEWLKDFLIKQQEILNHDLDCVSNKLKLEIKVGEGDGKI